MVVVVVVVVVQADAEVTIECYPQGWLFLGLACIFARV